MRPYAIAYGFAALVFVVLDAIWLTVMSDRLYRPALGHLMAQQVDWPAALLFYPSYLAGVIYFAVAPALAAQRARDALVRGALLGLLAYATYDLTNQATLQGWPWHVTLVDLVWGTFVTGAAAWAAAAGAIATSRRARPSTGR